MDYDHLKSIECVYLFLYDYSKGHTLVTSIYKERDKHQISTKKTYKSSYDPDPSPIKLVGINIKFD